MGPFDFVKGERVRYVPRHAGGIDDPECQDGVVSSVNDIWVFVKYDNAMCIMTTGCEKDLNMIELWDDRAIQLIKNTGQRADGK